MNLQLARVMTRVYFAISLLFLTIATVSLRLPVKSLTFEVYDKFNVYGKALVYLLAALTFFGQIVFYTAIFYLIFKVYNEKAIPLKMTKRVSWISLFLLLYALLMSRVMSFPVLL